MEDSIARRDVEIAAATGARLHLCHCSTAGSVDIVRDAKILEMARNEAIDFVKTNKIEDYPKLKEITSLTLFSGLDI